MLLSRSHKNWLDFSSATILSLLIHALILCVIFTIKYENEVNEYRDVVVKFGTDDLDVSELGNSVDSNQSTNDENTTLHSAANADANSNSAIQNTAVIDLKDTENALDEILMLGPDPTPFLAANLSVKTEETAAANVADIVPEGNNVTNEKQISDQNNIEQENDPLKNSDKVLEAPKDSLDSSNQSTVQSVDMQASKKIDEPVAPKTNNNTNARIAAKRIISAVGGHNFAEDLNYQELHGDNEAEPGSILGNSNASSASSASSYEQLLPLWLAKFKKYPAALNGANIAARGEIFITIDRNGKVLLSKIKTSTGSKALDKALMDMVKDASPVLPVPDSYHPQKKTFSFEMMFEFKPGETEVQDASGGN